MSGQIFISYRREESRWSARSLNDRLSANFGPNQIFMDIDGIAPGEDFVKVIETRVAQCDVLIAVIGKNWVTSKDDQGGRRLENPEDYVRMEIGIALKREIRVIPVLVDGASMPRSSELPDDLKPLVRRNALQITDTSFESDCKRLVAAIKQVLEKTATEPATTTPTPASTPTPTSTPASTALASSDRRFYTERGWDFFQKKDYDKAISDYDVAIRLDPNYAIAYTSRGLAYVRQGRYDQAQSDFAKAKELGYTQSH